MLESGPVVSNFIAFALLASLLKRKYTLRRRLIAKHKNEPAARKKFPTFLRMKSDLCLTCSW